MSKDTFEEKYFITWIWGNLQPFFLLPRNAILHSMPVVWAILTHPGFKWKTERKGNIFLSMQVSFLSCYYFPSFLVTPTPHPLKYLFSLLCKLFWLNSHLNCMWRLDIVFVLVSVHKIGKKCICIWFSLFWLHWFALR